MMAVAAIAGAQVNKGARRMQEAMDRFGKAKELKVYPYRYNHNMDELYFKYLYRPESMQDPLRVPDALRVLESAFADNSRHSMQTVVYHSDPGRRSTLGMQGLVYVFPDGTGPDIMFSYRLSPKHNYRIVTFADADSTRTQYLLRWRPVYFHDKDSVLYCAIDGGLTKVRGKDWRTRSYTPRDYTNRRGGLPVADVAGTDTLTGDMLVSQIKALRAKYADGLEQKDSRKCEAIALITKRMCRTFDGMLTAYQATEAKNTIAEMRHSYEMALFNQTAKPDAGAMFDLLKSDKKWQMLQEADYYIEKKSELNISERWKKTKTMSRVSVFHGGLSEIVHDPTYNKLTREDYDISGIPDTAGCMRGVKINVAGTSPATNSLLEVHEPTFDNTVAVTVRNGKFDIALVRLARSFMRFTDDKRNRQYVYADGEPTVVDMRRGILEGSETNMRLAKVFRRIKRLETETMKYITVSDCGNEIVDFDGFNALLDTFKAEVLRMIEENKDTDIPALLLSMFYQRLDYYDMKQAMDSTRVYAGHILMQPVWKYYEGLEKRRPGAVAADFECEDNEGVARRLSDYIGKGYVLLDFWDHTPGASRNGYAEIKHLYKKYGGKGFEVVAVNMNPDVKEWKDYIRRRALKKWVNLCDKDGLDGKAAKAYGVTCLPELILIGPDGRIVGHDLLDNKLKNMVDKVMREKPEGKRN